jgi:hypothetical protein
MTTEVLGRTPLRRARPVNRTRERIFFGGEAGDSAGTHKPGMPWRTSCSASRDEQNVTRLMAAAGPLLT